MMSGVVEKTMPDQSAVSEKCREKQPMVSCNLPGISHYYVKSGQVNQKTKVRIVTLHFCAKNDTK